MAFEQVMAGRLARWVSAEPDWDAVYALTRAAGIDLPAALARTASIPGG